VCADKWFSWRSPAKAGERFFVRDCGSLIACIGERNARRRQMWEKHEHSAKKVEKSFKNPLILAKNRV